MAAFFRGLLLFLFGAIVGAGGMLFFTPSFNVVVSRAPGALKPVEFAPAPAPVVVAAVPAVRKVAEPSAVPSVPVAPAQPPSVAVAAPAPEAAAEPTLDFKAIAEHLVLWPTSVTVKAATTVPVLVDGKKVQDLTLDVGTVLQVSKVLADGSLEARAKGAKFEIKSALTDFSAELGKRVAELVAKGTKFDSPYPAAVATATAPTAPAVASSGAVPVAIIPKGPLTLAQRVDVLFGNKPEVAAPAVPATPSSSTPVVAPAAAPATEVTPAAEPKAAEKGKDLDRKMNQLFK